MVGHRDVAGQHQNIDAGRIQLADESGATVGVHLEMEVRRDLELQFGEPRLVRDPGGAGSRTPFTQIGIPSALRGLATDAAESLRVRLFRLTAFHSDRILRTPSRLTTG